MNIGFTGTQSGMTEKQLDGLRQALSSNQVDRFIHGDCIGADTQAHNMVRKFYQDTQVVIRPCTLVNKRAFCDGGIVYAPKPPLERNREIVADCDLLIAAPKTGTERLRSGTWATVRYARKVGRSVLILVPANAPKARGGHDCLGEDAEDAGDRKYHERAENPKGKNDD